MACNGCSPSSVRRKKKDPEAGGEGDRDAAADRDEKTPPVKVEATTARAAAVAAKKEAAAAEKGKKIVAKRTREAAVATSVPVSPTPLLSAQQALLEIVGSPDDGPRTGNLSGCVCTPCDC